jgi:hypothetical protein
MSIDLGNSPTPPNANPTTEEANQIKSILGLNLPTIHWTELFTPTLPAFFLTGGSVGGIFLSDIYLAYAGVFAGSLCYTYDGQLPSGMGNELFRNGNGDVILTIDGNTFTSFAADPITIPTGYNDLTWTPPDPSDVVPDFIYKAIAMQPDEVGQLLVWENSLYTESYYISLTTDGQFASTSVDNPYWARLSKYGGDLGTPVYVNLANGAFLPLTTGVTGILPIANGGTGASAKSGVLGAVTNLITITDNANTTITLSDSMSGSVIRTTAAAAVTITVPNTLSANFNLTVIQQGTGQVTFSPGSGTVLQSKGTLRKISNQYGKAEILRVTTATYNLSGDLSA